MTTGRPLAPAKLRAAQVLRAHGVRGEVRAEPIGGDPSRFTPGTKLETEDGSRVLTVRTARPGAGNAVLLGFDEITSADRSRAPARSLSLRRRRRGSSALGR